MAKNRLKQRKEKRVKLKNALRKETYKAITDALSPEQLLELAHDLYTYIYWGIGDPTEERLLGLRNSFPLLDEMINFEIVLKRLDDLDSFERGYTGVNILVFLPELKEIYNAVNSRIKELPRGAQKAEYWLRPIARDAGADADVEAAVYLASRGKADLVDVDVLRGSWHAAVCRDIEHGKPVGKIPRDVLDRARSQTISLAEAETVLKLYEELPRFFGYRDEEEEFIDAAMFRAVEWFNITGFEPWLRSSISDLSSGPMYGIDHAPASWWLFFWCRSDLALRMAEKKGLESWIWALINGPIERDKPWRRFYYPKRENPRMRDYMPLVGIIPFVWHRIKPINMKDDVLHRATELLFKTQMHCGGWPLHADDSKPDLVASCFAIHGLAAHAPNGWKQSAARGAEWIASQQGEVGEWSISGGPTVMLTVLALDALDLAKGKRDVTFSLDASISESGSEGTVQTPSILELPDLEPTYDYAGQPWYQPDVQQSKSVALDQAHKSADPDLALVVATELELRQALLVMSHLPRCHRVRKVTHGNETYFLGRFGKFQCVLTLSSMTSQGPTGSSLTVDSVIREWNPVAVLLLGIAFGTSRKKQLPADVLIAEYVIPYEYQRLGDKPTIRNPVPPSSPTLVNRFRHALDWAFPRPDGSNCNRHIGPVLSGDKLIDNLDFKNSLLDQYPNAIGGEMEGAGLWSAAQRSRKDWIIIKGVCDWADGKKHDSYQEMAAAAAVSLALNVFSNPYALDGLR